MDRSIYGMAVAVSIEMDITHDKASVSEGEGRPRQVLYAGARVLSHSSYTDIPNIQSKQ